MTMDANVMEAAATSPLGILALLVLVMSSLALAVFRKTSVGVRLFVFQLMFAATCGFGLLVFQTARSSEVVSVSLHSENAVASKTVRYKRCDERPPIIVRNGGYRCSLTQAGAGTWTLSLRILDKAADVSCQATCRN